MVYLQGIAALILTIINLIIYHKVFDVYYFGGVGKGLFKEIFWAFVIAGIEIVLFRQFKGVCITIAVIVGVIVIIKKLGTDSSHKKEGQ